MFKGFQKPKRLVANTETLTERFGQFTAQPFERGFGSTIGNGLRRVLLSSIEGAAITAVRIEGVAHEFSPIPGVTEDATDIILNLKQIPFKMTGEGTRTVRVRVDAPGEVTSGQIVRATGVRSGNPIVEGTRIGVHDVIGLLQNGETPESLMATCFPQLTRANVYECLAYCEDYGGEVDVLIARQMANGSE